MTDKASTNSETHEPFDPTLWARANPWLSEGQADDRTPMNGPLKKAIEHIHLTAHSHGDLTS